MGKIAEITVPAGGQATIDFTGIDQTYKHLVLVITGHTATAGTSFDAIRLTFNGDGGANYASGGLYNSGTGTTPTDYQGGTAQTSCVVGWLAQDGGAQATAMIEASIPRYTDATFPKAYTASCHTSASPTANRLMVDVGGDWTGQAAITRITLSVDNAGTFAAGTVATLYGVEPQAGAGAKVTTTTANYTLVAADSLVLVNAANLTMTLPDVATVATGIAYRIKNTGAASGTTVAAASGQTIDGAATQALAAAEGALTVQSDGAHWWIVAKV